MFFATTIAVTLLAGVATTSPVARGVTAPFNLTVTSVESSGPYKNTSVNACHTAAGQEAFCVLPGDKGLFTFDHVLTSDQSPGYLQYTVNSNPPQIQQLAIVSKSDTSNVEYGFFGTDSSIELKTLSDGQIGVPVSSSETQYEWVVCPQTTLGYTYNTIGFVKDFADPTDADCNKVFLYMSS